MKFDFFGDLWRSMLPLLMVSFVGCGGGDSDTTTSTSNDEIAEFIEENPEFGDSASKPSNSKPLGLEN